jgi:myo-inositol-1(or 4)-monophosphatase
MPRRSADITVMVQAAYKAARNLARDFGEVENLQVSIKGPGDFVSAADRKAEQVLVEELQRARPRFGFLLEESGVIEGDDRNQRWIVDPLDGTTNFLHGLPQFAISIALERRRELVAGVVYDPIKDETFWAEKGSGAFLNDRRLRVSARTDLTTCVIGSGLPVLDWPKRDAHAGQVARVAGQVAGIRRFGAAALDLAYVAAGRLDGFWEYGLKPWDVAAGIVLIREAGGLVEHLEGGSDLLEPGTLVAANPGIHTRLTELLQDTG